MTSVLTRAAAKQLIARLLCAVGVPAVTRWRKSRRLAILMFHGVEGEPVDPPCSYVLDAATLRRELTYVRKHFHVLPLEEAVERLRDGSLPPAGGGTDLRRRYAQPPDPRRAGPA